MIGDGFEGDMIFPQGFDPRSPNKAKGVAKYGNVRWPYGIIPYDISAISCKYHCDIVPNSFGKPFLL